MDVVVGRGEQRASALHNLRIRGASLDRMVQRKRRWSERTAWRMRRDGDIMGNERGESKEILVDVVGRCEQRASALHDLRMIGRGLNSLVQRKRRWSGRTARRRGAGGVAERGSGGVNDTFTFTIRPVRRARRTRRVP